MVEKKTRIISFDAGDFRCPTPSLTVQRLNFINGRCQDNEGGCAIFQKLGGTTVVIGSTFENNVGPTTGQDTAGGAIWTIGGGDTTIVGSVFRNNKCSNDGALVRYTRDGELRPFPAPAPLQLHLLLSRSAANDRFTAPTPESELPISAIHRSKTLIENKMKEDLF